jgi:hypothetical protein
MVGPAVTIGACSALLGASGFGTLRVLDVFAKTIVAKTIAAQGAQVVLAGFVKAFARRQ